MKDFGDRFDAPFLPPNFFQKGDDAFYHRASPLASLFSVFNDLASLSTSYSPFEIPRFPFCVTVLTLFIPYQPAFFFNFHKKFFRTAIRNIPYFLVLDMIFNYCLQTEIFK